jgi:hypothetical protein
MVPLPEQPFSEAHGTKATLMINRTQTRRSDEELAFILHETASWTVKGQHGASLCEVASLRCAVDSAVELGAIGQRIVALVRRGHSDIVVFSAQIQRLASEHTAPLDWAFALYAKKA